MRTITIILLAWLSMSCTKEEQPYYTGCECELVKGYRVEVCEGQDWNEASINALEQLAKDSNCN